MCKTQIEINLTIAKNTLSAYNGYEFSEEGTRLRFKGMSEVIIQNKLREYGEKRKLLESEIKIYESLVKTI